MYVALYSILWLSYKSEIKQSRDYLEKLKKEEKRLAKMKDATIEDELKEIENDYAHKEIGLRNAERRFDFVNITLRRFALLASIATIIDFFV